jgi:hypothetical protein
LLNLQKKHSHLSESQLSRQQTHLRPAYVNAYEATTAVREPIEQPTYLRPCCVNASWRSDVQQALVPELHRKVRLHIAQRVWVCAALRCAAVPAHNTAHVRGKARLQVVAAALHVQQTRHSRLCYGAAVS